MFNFMLILQILFLSMKIKPIRVLNSCLKTNAKISFILPSTFIRINIIGGGCVNTIKTVSFKPRMSQNVVQLDPPAWISS